MSSRSLRLFLATVLAACAFAAAGAPRMPLVTMQDGDAVLLRDGARFALAEGVRLQAGDLIATARSRACCASSSPAARDSRWAPTPAPCSCPTWATTACTPASTCSPAG